MLRPVRGRSGAEERGQLRRRGKSGHLGTSPTGCRWNLSVLSAALAAVITLNQVRAEYELKNVGAQACAITGTDPYGSISANLGSGGSSFQWIGWPSASYPGILANAEQTSWVAGALSIAVEPSDPILGWSCAVRCATLEITYTGPGGDPCSDLPLPGQVRQGGGRGN